MRDTEWVTVNCPLSYETSGAIPPYMDDAQLLSVDRSPDSTLLVAGDALGGLKLLRNPCTAMTNAARHYAGHTSTVSVARFSSNGKTVISVGAVDRCIFQWKVVGPPRGDDWAAKAAKASELATDDDATTVGAPPKPAHSLIARNTTDAGSTGSTKHPWLSATVEPSSHVENLARAAASSITSKESDVEDAESGEMPREVNVSALSSRTAAEEKSAALALEHVYGASKEREMCSVQWGVQSLSSKCGFSR